MALLTSKWVLGTVAVLAVLLAASLLSRKSVHTERVIPAAPEAIWAVLTDHAAYAQWNPVLVEAPAPHTVGTTIAYQLREPSGRQYELKATVRAADAPRLLNQVGGIPLVLTFNHQFRLEPVDGGTRVVQHEDYRGLGVWFWDESWVEPAYAAVNEALEARVAASSE